MLIASLLSHLPAPFTSVLDIILEDVISYDTATTLVIDVISCDTITILKDLLSLG